MRRWDAFVLVCDYLREGLLGEAPVRNAQSIRWEALINTSSRHYVTPALAWCLRGFANIPTEIRAYFEAALALNGERNVVQLTSLARIVAALNEIDIEPLLLKGASHLIDGSYPDPSLRFLGDLDVLVPEDKAAEAASKLKALGFSENNSSLVPPSHHHLSMLVDRETGAGVEIHKQPAPSTFQGVVSTRWFWEGATPFPFRDLRVRLPSPTKRVVLNVVHDQLFNRQYQRQGAELRQLLDLSLLRAQHDGEIDWSEVDRRFCDAGAGQVLATYLEFARALLGQPPPQVSCAPRLNAIEGFKSRMASWRAARRMATEYVAARRRQPLGIFRLLNPRTWANRLRLLRAGFDTTT